MMPAPPDAPLTVRLGAKLGPELIASILVVAVVIVAATVALTGRRGGAVVTPSPDASSAAHASASTAPSSIAPSGAPPSGAAPSGALPGPPATALLQLTDRILDERANLEAELAKTGTDTVAIVDLLGEINASLVLEEGPLADLAASPATADLAARIGRVNATAADAIRRTQRASIRNEEAYRDGATEVVAALKPLTAIRTEIVALSGGSP
jgi:hypothetical protein